MKRSRVSVPTAKPRTQSDRDEITQSDRDRRTQRDRDERTQRRRRQETDRPSFWLVEIDGRGRETVRQRQ